MWANAQLPLALDGGAALTRQESLALESVQEFGRRPFVSPQRTGPEDLADDCCILEECLPLG